MIDLTQKFFKLSRQLVHRKLEDSEATVIGREKAAWLQRYAQLLHEVKLVLLCSQSQPTVTNLSATIKYFEKNLQLLKQMESESAD